MAYWRSEFVVISPKDRRSTIETRGDVPPPVVTEKGTARHAALARRRKPRRSRGAGERAHPGVFAERAHRLGDLARRSAGASRRCGERRDSARSAHRAHRAQAAPSGAERRRARAQALSLGARQRRGRSRERRTPCRGGQAGISDQRLPLPVPHARHPGRSGRRPRTSPPAARSGPISEAEKWDGFVVRVGRKDPEWLTVRDKFAPFGYVPAGLRGQPAHRLVPGTPMETTSARGSFDGVVYEGGGEVSTEGAASLELAQKFVGKAAIGLRAGLEQLPAAQLPKVIEGKLLAQAIPGAHLIKVDIENQADLDQPIAMRMKIEVTDFARRRGGSLVLHLRSPSASRSSRACPSARRRSYSAIRRTPPSTSPSSCRAAPSCAALHRSRSTTGTAGSSSRTVRRGACSSWIA